MASSEGHITTVQLLLEAKADANASDLVSILLVRVCVGAWTMSRNQ